MAKKIYDILPPKAKVSHQRSKAHSIKKEVKNIHNPIVKKAKKERRFPAKVVFVVVLVFLLVPAVYFYFKLQRANIEIWPKTETVSFKEKLVSDASSQSLDFAQKIIPAQKFEAEKDLWQEFQATGNTAEAGRAKGTITVYNNYTPFSPVALKKGTHFLSDSGKYFTTLKQITIPAAKKQGSKTVPGSIDTQVQAVEAGEDSNIKPAKFSVPKLAGNSYYYSVYAESEKDMTGGFSSQKKEVTENDLQNAKDAITKKLSEDTEKALREKVSQDYILLDGSVVTEIIESGSAVKAGAVVDKFNYQAKAKSTALAFKKSDLESFIKEHIRSNVSGDKELLENSFNFSYSPEAVDVDEGKITFNLDFSAKTYGQVDKNDLIGILREKSSNEVKESIESRLGDKLDSVKVDFWPFWTTKAPRDKNKIKIELKFAP